MRNDQKMNSILASAAFMLFAMIVVTALPAASAEVLLEAPGYVISGSIVKYDPTPAEPGNYMTIWIKLSNLGNSQASNAVIEFVPTYPFSMDGSDDLKKTVRLGSQQDYIFEYKIRVDPKAVTGSNDIKFRATGDGNQADPIWQEIKIPITVRSSEASITVTDVKVDNGVLAPGVPSKVVLTLKNTAGMGLKNIAASLDLFTTTASSATSTSLIDVSIAPVGTTTRAYVTRLGISEQATITFDLAAYPDAKSKLYKIPLTLTFEDDAGNSYTKEDLVGIFVSSTPDLVAIVDSTALTQDVRTGTVSIKVINKGLSDAKFVSVTLKHTEDAQIIGQSDSVYIGKLDSDDFETVDFKLKVADGKAKVSLPIEITFLDSLNKQYTKQFPLELELFDGKTLNGSSSVWPIVIVALIVIAGIVWWVRSRKAKRK